MRQVRTEGGFQPLEVGARSPGAHALPDGGADAAGLRRLFPARAGRGPAVHLPRDGGAHLLARRHGAAGGRAGHRQDRARAAGSAVRGQDPQLFEARRVADHFPDQGFVQARRRGERLVHGAQEDRRHALHAAGRHPGPVLQRRLRRRLRRDLRAGVGRLQLRRAQELRRRRAPAAAARAGRGQGRTVRRAGREGLRRDFAEAPGPARARHQPGAAAAGPAERGGIRRRGADAAGRGAGAGGRPVRGRGAAAGHADPRQLGQPAAPGRHRRRSRAATSIRRPSRCGTRARK